MTISLWYWYVKCFPSIASDAEHILWTSTLTSTEYISNIPKDYTIQIWTNDAKDDPNKQIETIIKNGNNMIFSNTGSPRLVRLFGGSQFIVLIEFILIKIQNRTNQGLPVQIPYTWTVDFRHGLVKAIIGVVLTKAGKPFMKMICTKF